MGRVYLAGAKHASNTDDWGRPAIEAAVLLRVLRPEDDACHGRREQMLQQWQSRSSGPRDVARAPCALSFVSTNHCNLFSSICSRASLVLFAPAEPPLTDIPATFAYPRTRLDSWDSVYIPRDAQQLDLRPGLPADDGVVSLRAASPNNAPTRREEEACGRGRWCAASFLCPRV